MSARRSAVCGLGLWIIASATVLAQQPPPATVTAAAVAQASMVRTMRDRVAVWRRSPSQILAMLPKDVDLEALAKEGQWYQVRVPEKYAGAGGAIGYVAETMVTLVSGPPPPARAATSATPDSRFAAAPPPSLPAPSIRVRGYGSFAYEWLSAKKSFDAVLGQRAGLFYGGGGQVVFGHLFVDVGVEQFRKTGERVVVFNGEVFKLGIPDTITLQPFTVTGGYRFAASRNMVPYVGGGVGSLHFQETSKFSDPGEDTDQRFTSYVVLGGVEYAVHKWVFVSGEVRYTSVPNAIGAPGVAGDFDEKNLGGVSAMLKVMIGN
jgi:opacity protein-like surface antigen